MSFGGGGGTQYRIDYVIRVENQGGTGATAFNQVSTATKQMTAETHKATASQQQLTHVNNQVSQASLGVSKASKGLAFGLLGITTAGAEAIGMFGMWQDTQKGVKDAQEAVNAALQEGGKNSKAYKDAQNDLSKANRWAAMTNRNLMLSMFDLVPFVMLTVNGIFKLRTALKAMAAARAAQKALQALGTTTHTVAAASNVAAGSMSTFGKHTLLMKTNSFALTPSLLKNAAGMGAITIGANGATVAVTKLSKAMRVLTIASKILIPLIALEIGAQAYQRNWGGFADKINTVGHAIGSTIPQLKGFLGLIKKVGESIVAVFTGNWDDIGKIWSDKEASMTDALGLSEDDQKKMDEAEDHYIESIHNILDEIQGLDDKKDRRNLAKDLGFDKFRSEVAELFKDIDEAKTKFSSFDQLMDMFRSGIFDLGDDLEDVREKGFLKDLIKDWKKDFNNIEKQLGLDSDFFDPIINILENAKGKTGPEISKLIAQTIIDNPELKQLLGVYAPQLLADAQDEVDRMTLAMKQYNADNLAKNQAVMDKLTGKDNVALNDAKYGKKEDKMFADTITKLKAGFAELTTYISGLDWASLGTKVREGILSIFNMPVAIGLGAFLRANVVVPLFTALSTAFAPEIAAFQKDPFGAIVGVVNRGTSWIGAFVAGLFGKKTEQELFQGWENELVTIFNGIPAFVTLKAFIANPMGGLMDLLNGRSIGGTSTGNFNENEMETFPDRGHGGISLDNITTWIDETFAQPIIGAINWGWGMITGFLQTHGWLRKLFTGDIIGGIWDLFDMIKKSVTSGTVENKAAIATATTISKDLGITNFFDQTKLMYDTIVTNLKNKGADLLLMISDPAAWLKQKADQAAQQKLLDEGKLLDENNLPIPPDKYGPDMGTPGFYKQSYNTGSGKTDQEKHLERSQATMDALRKKSGSYTTQTGPEPQQQWTNMAKEAGTASSQIQTVWSSMFVALKGIMDAIAQHWSQVGIGLIATATSVTQVAAAAFNTFVQNTAGMFTLLAGHWSGQGANMIATGQSIAQVLYDVLNQSLQNIAGVMNMLGSHWSMHANKMGANAQSGADQIVDALEGAMSDVESAMTDMAKHWSKVCNSLGANARSAAKQINKALDSIEDEEVIIRYKTEGTPGGRHSHGTDQWVHKPTLFLAGEAGSERITVTRAHSKPGVGSDDDGEGSGSESGTTIFNGTVNLKISGNDIINDSKLQRKIKMTVGENRDRFGA